MENIAIVTGASRGLGLALVRALAAEGWGLVIDARGPEALEAARRELEGLTRVVALPGDVGQPEHAAALVEAARGLGGLRALVNNASVLGPSPQPRLEAYPLEALEEVYRVNTFAPLRLAQLAMPLMEPGAAILNVSSDAAVEGYEGWGGYGSSKAALELWGRVLAAERPDLKVYTLDPGDMNTQLHQEAFPGEDISDRPPPEGSVPGLMRLLRGDLESGRYRAADLAGEGATR